LPSGHPCLVSPQPFVGISGCANPGTKELTCTHTHTHHTNTTQRANARQGQPASRHVTKPPDDDLNQGQQLVHTPVLVGPRPLGERWSRGMRAQKNLRTLPPFARATNNTTQGTPTHVRKCNVRLHKPAVVITTTLLNAFSQQSRNVARSVRERSAWKGSALTHTHTHTVCASLSRVFLAVVLQLPLAHKG
jgi:hypothetical protein